jgi:hypothetical protein
MPIMTLKTDAINAKVILLRMAFWFRGSFREEIRSEGLG